MEKPTISEGDKVSDIQSLTDQVRDLNQAVDCWNTATVVALIFAALAALAIVLTTRMGLKRAKQLAAAQGELLQAKDRQLVSDLKEKDTKIADAMKSAAEANEKAEREKLARLKLEKELAPRRLTGEQKTKLVKLLEKNPGEIAIVSAVVDGESSDFADDFDSAFKLARWKTVRIANRITLNRGVSVGTVTGTRSTDAERVSNALEVISIPHAKVSFSADDHSTSPWFQSGVLYLVIEHKPDPRSQNEAANPR